MGQVTVEEMDAFRAKLPDRSTAIRLDKAPVEGMASDELSDGAAGGNPVNGFPGQAPKAKNSAQKLVKLSAENLYLALTAFHELHGSAENGLRSARIIDNHRVQLSIPDPKNPHDGSMRFTLWIPKDFYLRGQQVK